LSAIDVADFPAFRRLGTRTAWLRRAAALLALLFALAAALAIPRDRAPAAALVPAGSNAIAVVDVSASISWDTYARIASTLHRLRGEEGRAGLVLFSDTAYQALPPGTPVAELGGFERFFVVKQPRSAGLEPQPQKSPWTDSFSAGTKISTGLDLARSILIGDRLARPAVLLVSDLDDDSSDLPNLGNIATAYRQEHIGLNIVGLNPSAEDERFFQKFVAGNGTLSHAQLPGEEQAATGAPFTWTLALVALALVALLALNELWTARLTWREA